nr:hypothetical protein Itr_chr03CG22430 [Ipomoea trifida]
MDCQAEETDISKQAHRRSPCSKPPGKPIKSTSIVVDEEQAAGMPLTTKETQFTKHYDEHRKMEILMNR